MENKMSWQESNDKWKIFKSNNIEAIKKSGLVFSMPNGDQVLCFREDDKPHANYFPGTGTFFQVNPRGPTIRDKTVEEFLEWYRGLEVEVQRGL